jgi:hypothetical protein
MFVALSQIVLADLTLFDLSLLYLFGKSAVRINCRMQKSSFATRSVNGPGGNANNRDFFGRVLTARIDPFALHLSAVGIEPKYPWRSTICWLTIT